MLGEQEQFFQCPHCFSPISMVFETYHGSQSYIEDCEVCCRPIKVTYETDGEEITSLNVDPTD